MVGPILAWVEDLAFIAWWVLLADLTMIRLGHRGLIVWFFGVGWSL